MLTSPDKNRSINGLHTMDLSTLVCVIPYVNGADVVHRLSLCSRDVRAVCRSVKIGVTLRDDLPEQELAVIARSWPKLGQVTMRTLTFSGASFVKTFKHMNDLTVYRGLRSQSPDLYLGQHTAILQNLNRLALYDSHTLHVEWIRTCSNLTELCLLSTHISDLQFISSLKRLRFLNIRATHVKSLSPLVQCFWLEELDASWTRVWDLSWIKPKTLPRLRVLNIGWTQVEDVSPATMLSNLRVLNLMGTSLSTINGSHSWVCGLRSLDISWTSFQSLQNVVSCRSIKTLDISGCSVDDFSALKDIALESLNATKCSLGDLSCLSHLTSLTNLSVAWNAVSSSTPLEGLYQLKTLNLSFTMVKSIRVPQSLTSLDLSGTYVSDLEPVSCLSNLHTLYIENLKVHDLEPLQRCVSLQTVHKFGTVIL